MLIRGDLITPVGTLFVVEDQATVLALGFVEQEPELTARLQLSTRPGVPACLPRLGAYLDGALDALDEVPVRPEGTPFQKRVWQQLRRIPAGETRSYRDIARALGDAEAVRAVGAANGRNPISVIIPCHRVIRADGTLCGYAGGLPRKRWLLDHERAAV